MHFQLSVSQGYRQLTTSSKTTANIHLPLLENSCSRQLRLDVSELDAKLSYTVEMHNHGNSTLFSRASLTHVPKNAV